MLEKARLCKLELEKIPARPDPLLPREESRTTFYKLVPEFHRPIDLADPDAGPTNENLHPSVLTRYRADSSYRPKNLEDYLRRNPQMLQT
jgi:hypothetical protein